MSQPTVLLLEPVAAGAHARLAATARVLLADSPDAGIDAARRADIDAIITRGKGQIDASLLAACPHLRVAARCGVGLDNVDVDTATQRGVAVVFAPGSNAATVAEHTLALMLSLQRQLYPLIKAVREGQWQARNHYGGDELRGKTLGILGMGHIGQRVAALATAFGMEVIYWGRNKPELPYPALELDAVLERADIVSLHLPLTPQTHRLLGSERLARLQPHALLINTARGAIIDQEALTAALAAGRLGGFAADVLAEQPPPPDAELLRLPNVIITPHAASLTARTFEEMCMMTVENTLALLRHEAVDPHYIFNHSQLQAARQP